MKKIFLRKVLWTGETQFSKPCNFLAKSQKIPQSSSETTNIYYSQKFFISWKNSFGRHNLHFCQPSPKNYHQKPKNTTLKVRKHIKKINIYWSNIHLDKKLEFCKSCQKKTNSFMLFHSSPEIIQKVLVFVP